MITTKSNPAPSGAPRGGVCKDLPVLALGAPEGVFLSNMKTPETMTRAELIAYAGDLKKMIGGLQTQLTKALEAVAAQHSAKKGAAA